MGTSYRYAGKGEPCPRCGETTEAREHRVVKQRQLNQPFYYSRWYVCTNDACKTTLIMPEEFKVYNKNKKSRYFTSLQERRDCLDFIRSIAQ